MREQKSSRNVFTCQPNFNELESVARVARRHDWHTVWVGVTCQKRKPHVWIVAMSYTVTAINHAAMTAMRAKKTPCVLWCWPFQTLFFRAIDIAARWQYGTKGSLVRATLSLLCEAEG